MHTSPTIIKLINFDHNNLPTTLKQNIKPESKTVNSASWMYYKVKGNFYPEILTFKLKVTKNLQNMLIQKCTDIKIKDFYTMHSMGNFNINIIDLIIEHKMPSPCIYKAKTIPTDESWCTCVDLLQLH